ncbi:MAG: alpha/beta hydrolase [Polyangiaceae bacterium]|nr:alpha/beta hydrolase [Polyangiaceae bacterium]
MFYSSEALLHKNDDAIAQFWQQDMQKGFVDTRQGKLFYAYHLPYQADFALVISSGRIEAAQKYQELLWEFARNNIAVFIVDHQGQGRSYRHLEDSHKGYVGHFDDYSQDLAQFEEELDQSLALWGSEKYGVHHSLASFARSSIGLAQAEPEVAFRALAHHKKNAKRGINRVQVTRIIYAQHLAYAHLQAAQLGGSKETARPHGQVREIYHQLRAEKNAAAATLALHLRAIVDLNENYRPERALEWLKAVEKRYSRMDMLLYARSVDIQIGQVIGGRKGEEKIKHSELSLLRAGFDQPRAVMRLFAPSLLIQR